MNLPVIVLIIVATTCILVLGIGWMRECKSHNETLRLLRLRDDQVEKIERE